MVATVQVATATAYAACAADSRNFAGAAQGAGIDTSYSNNNQNLNAVNSADATPEACCSSCLANPLCISTAFEPQFPAGQQCYQVLSTQGSCAVGSYDLAVVVNNPPLPPDDGYIISNGNCGFYDSVSN